MGRRLRVVEITLQAGESATSGFCGLSCERRPRRQGRAARDIQIPYYRIE